MNLDSELKFIHLEDDHSLHIVFVQVFSSRIWSVTNHISQNVPASKVKLSACVFRAQLKYINKYKSGAGAGRWASCLDRHRAGSQPACLGWSVGLCSQSGATLYIHSQWFRGKLEILVFILPGLFIVFVYLFYLYVLCFSWNETEFAPFLFSCMVYI